MKVLTRRQESRLWGVIDKMSNRIALNNDLIKKINRICELIRDKEYTTELEIRYMKHMDHILSLRAKNKDIFNKREKIKKIVAAAPAARKQYLFDHLYESERERGLDFHSIPDSGIDLWLQKASNPHYW